MNKNDWKNEKLKEENESFDSEEETTEGSLIKNIKDFANSASKIYREADYTSAAILYFKALFGVLDLIVLRKKGFIPKDHNDRFRILEKDFPEFYLILDKNFHIYQSSYRKSIEREVCNKIKEDAERIIEEQKI